MAVLPASASSGNTETDATTISEGIGNDDAFTITLIGKKLDAVAGPSTGAPAGGAESLARQAFSDHSSSFDQANVTGAIVELVQSIEQNEADSGSTNDNGGTAIATATPEPSQSNTGAIVLAVIVVLLLALLGLFLLRRSIAANRRRQAEFDAAKDEVNGLYNRLANDVATINVGEDRTAQQAMADASERYNTAGTGLTLATSSGQLAAARRTIIEGVEAARTARRSLGLDPGPDPAPAPETGQQTIRPGDTINVGGQSYQGYPSYQPGNGYYFGGGNYNGGYVPGGWYATPFWSSFLLPRRSSAGSAAGATAEVASGTAAVVSAGWAVVGSAAVTTRDISRDTTRGSIRTLVATGAAVVTGALLAAVTGAAAVAAAVTGVAAAVAEIGAVAAVRTVARGGSGLAAVRSCAWCP